LRSFSFLVWLAVDLVGELDDRVPEQGGARFDQDLIVVAGWGAIATAGLNNGQNALMINLQLAVGKARERNSSTRPISNQTR